MTTNKQKYLWIHKKNPDDSILQIIDDPIELFKTGQLNEAFDKLYQIGPEVKLKVVLEPQQSYRLSEEHLKTVRASGYRTPFENRD